MFLKVREREKQGFSFRFNFRPYIEGGVKNNLKEEEKASVRRKKKTTFATIHLHYILFYLHVDSNSNYTGDPSISFSSTGNILFYSNVVTSSPNPSYHFYPNVDIGSANPSYQVDTDIAYTFNE